MDRFRTTSGDAFRDPSSYKNSKKNNVSGNSSCASTLLKGQEEEPNSDELLGSAETIDRTNYDRRSAKGLEKRKTNEAVLDLEDQIRATIYGHCIGDAIGLLTEFMSQDQAHANYDQYDDKLELDHKVNDRHRKRWKVGDWTDDSDQMILIMQSLTAMKGQVSPADFATRLHEWTYYGFTELGDRAGLGIGHTTYMTVTSHCFRTDPHKAAKQTWKKSGRKLAPNGGVMRTSILGIHEFWDLRKVIQNAKDICRTTHYDLRCQASVVAVCVAIALMLQRQPPYFDSTTSEYNIEEIISECYQCTVPVLTDSYQVDELRSAVMCYDLADLRLDEESSIGYTFKCLGAGFWALRQHDFRRALTDIAMSGGDADTNGAVAGALLGCKLMKTSRLPESWYNGLIHRTWLNDHLSRYLVVLRKMNPSTFSSMVEEKNPSSPPSKCSKE